MSTAPSADDTGHDALLDVADMLGPFSHEVLNVLNNVVLKAAVLGRLVPQDLRQQVDEFRVLGHRASELLAKVQRARQGVVISRQPVDLNEVVQGVLSACRKQGVAMEEKAAPHLPPVWGNQVDARRLVRLLLRMAQTFSPQGPIAVATRQVGPAIVLRVSDAGPPVEADQLSAFFEPFGGVRPSQSVVERAALLTLARRLDVTLRAEGGAMTAEFAPADGQ